MELLKQNERGANRAAANVMRITVAVFVVVLILDFIGIFTVDISTMVTAFIIGSVLLFIPTLIVNVFKIEKGWVKYVIVLCAILFTVILSVTCIPRGAAVRLPHRNSKPVFLHPSELLHDSAYAGGSFGGTDTLLPV